MSIKDIKNLKFIEKDLFFPNLLKFQNSYSRNLICKQKGFVNNYFIIFCKEIIYLAFKKIFYKNFIETLISYSFCLRSKQIRNFLNILFSHLNFVYLVPKKFILFFILLKNKKINLTKIIPNKIDFFCSFFIKNDMIKNYKLKLNLSLLEIKHLKNIKLKLKQNKVLKKTNCIFFLFKRINYTKKNKESRYFIFKLIIFIFRYILNTVRNKRFNAWLTRSGILNTIDGKSLEAFSLYAKTIRKKFNRFTILDNLFQIYFSAIPDKKRFKVLKNLNLFSNLNFKKNLWLSFRFLSLKNKKIISFDIIIKSLFACSQNKRSSEGGGHFPRLLSVLNKITGGFNLFNWYFIGKDYFATKKNSVLFLILVLGKITFNDLIQSKKKFENLKKSIFLKNKENLKNSKYKYFSKKLILLKKSCLFEKQKVFFNSKYLNARCISNYPKIGKFDIEFDCLVDNIYIKKLKIVLVKNLIKIYLSLPIKLYFSKQICSNKLKAFNYFFLSEYFQKESKNSRDTNQIRNLNLIIKKMCLFSRLTFRRKFFTKKPPTFIMRIYLYVLYGLSLKFKSKKQLKQILQDLIHLRNSYLRDVIEKLMEVILTLIKKYCSYKSLKFLPEAT